MSGNVDTPFSIGGEFMPARGVSRQPLYKTDSIAPSPGPDASPNNDRNVRRLVRVTQPTAAFLADEGTNPAVMPNEIPNDQTGSFDDRFGSWTSSGATIAPRGPYQAMPPQAARSLGIVAGDPTPNFPFPPAIWGFPNEKDAPEDWTVGQLRRPNRKQAP
jgi:hypothetical protein